MSSEHSLHTVMNIFYSELWNMESCRFWLNSLLVTYLTENVNIDLIELNGSRFLPPNSSSNSQNGSRFLPSNLSSNSQNSSSRSSPNSLDLSEKIKPESTRKSSNSQQTITYDYKLRKFTKSDQYVDTRFKVLGDGRRLAKDNRINRLEDNEIKMNLNFRLNLLYKFINIG